MYVTPRTSALLLAALVGTLSLTACNQDGDSAGKGSVAVSGSNAVVSGDGGSVNANGANASASAAPGAPSTTSGGRTVGKPADLPAGLPLPGGDLVAVTGGSGAYLLTYRVADPATAVAAYENALKAGGYDVVAAAGAVTAGGKGASVVVTAIADGLTVAVSGS